MNYQHEKQKFLKIYVSHPKYIPQLRSTVEKGIQIDGQDVLSETTYESNLLYNLRFMIDNEINGMTWIRVEKKNWLLRSEKRKETQC